MLFHARQAQSGINGNRSSAPITQGREPWRAFCGGNPHHSGRGDLSAHASPNGAR